MVHRGDNRFFYPGTVSACRSKPVGDSALEQTPGVPVAALLSYGTTGVPWNRSCGELQKMGQSMADIWQFTLYIKATQTRMFKSFSSPSAAVFQPTTSVAS